MQLINQLTEHEEETVGAGEAEWVPAFVLVVDHRVDAVPGGQRKEDHAEVSGK